MPIGIVVVMPEEQRDPISRSDLRRGARPSASYASAITSMISCEDRRLSVMCALVAAAMLQDPGASEDIEHHPLLSAGHIVSTTIGSRDRLVWQSRVGRHPDSIDLTELELNEAVEAIRRQTDPDYRQARSTFLDIIAGLERNGIDYLRTRRADELYIRGSMQRIAIDRDLEHGYSVSRSSKDRAADN